MVRTSRHPDSYTELELETLELISTLANMPGFKRLGEVVKEKQQQYFVNLARGFASSSNPVDQREIDYKRGFWQGALWAVQALPKIKTDEWEKFVTNALKEGENPE